jgi:hypothetical protein
MCSRFVVAAFGVASILSTASAAFAEEAPPAARSAEVDRAPALVTNEPAIKHLALELNPLAATIGRYSAQVEYLPVAHHALVLNPHFDHVTADVEQSSNDVKVKYEQSFTGFGGEVGYRFYTGEKGANGFYIGPSFLFGTYSTSAGDVSGPSFTTFGGAIDIGGQAIVGPGIVIGGGFGLQYTKASEDFSDLPLTAAVLAGGGIRPRFLFTVGYAL